MRAITSFSIIVILLPAILVAKTLNDFAPKNYWLGITAEAPPAMMWVVDSQGRISGADPSLSLDQNGFQGDEHHGLEEIPASVTDQENIQNELTGQPQDKTLWSVAIPDGGSANYTLNLKGVETGICYVGIHIGSYISKSSNNYMGVFVTPAGFRKLNIAFDANHVSAKIQRVVSNTDLLTDITTSCQLKQITSEHVCRHLEDQAEAIQAALDHQHYEEAERLIWIFLHSLGESRPEGCQDDDDHSAVQEPTLTILKEDTKALLAQVQKDEHIHQGGHDHGGDNTH